MDKIISNEEYETALASRDNRLIMEKACSRFRSSINEDELKECKLLALWNTLKTWKPNKRKFTSFLYKKVQWECLKKLQYNKRYKNYGSISDKPAKPYSTVFDELIEKLSPEEKDIIRKRYIDRMTLREISVIYSCCHETARKKIKVALNQIKSSLA